MLAITLIIGSLFLMVGCNDRLPMTDGQDPDQGQFFGPIPADFANTMDPAAFQDAARKLQTQIAPGLKALSVPASGMAAKARFLQPGANAEAALNQLPDPNSCGSIQKIIGGFLAREDIKKAATPSNMGLTTGRSCQLALAEVGLAFPGVLESLEVQMGAFVSFGLTGDSCTGIRPAKWKSKVASVGFEFIRKAGAQGYSLTDFNVPTFRGGVEGGGNQNHLAFRSETKIHSRSEYKGFTRRFFQWAGVASFVELREGGEGVVTTEKVENLKVVDWEKGYRIRETRLMRVSTVNIDYGENPHIEETSVYSRYEDDVLLGERQITATLIPTDSGWELNVHGKRPDGTTQERTVRLVRDGNTCTVQE